MLPSMPSSNASAPCRLEWRPSRWVAIALCLLTVFSVPSLLASDLPRPFAWLIAVVASTAGWRSMGRELRRPTCEIWMAGDGQVTVDGEAVHAFAIDWRGPIAFLSWRDAEGRMQRRSFWPDTLPPPRRRELRLAARDRMAPPETGGMAH